MRSAYVLSLALTMGHVSASMTAEDFAKQLYDLHNKEREKNGVAAFECLDSQLSQLSADHVKYEISIDDINHDGFDERCKKVGGDVMCGENTLYDFVGDAVVFTKSWMDSSGHRENILNPIFKHAGFAVEKGPSGKWFSTGMFSDKNPNPNVCDGPKPSPSPPYTKTPGPTNDPTDGPTNDPTDGPTSDPTDGPTNDPTDDPTSNPTEDPTEDPTEYPTEDPTDGPTDKPTDTPTSKPTTQAPTSGPTPAPTDTPSSSGWIYISLDGLKSWFRVTKDDKAGVRGAKH